MRASFITGGLCAVLAALTLGCAGDPEPEGGKAPASTAAVGTGEGGLEAVSFAEAQEAGESRILVHYVPSSGFAGEGRDGELTGVTIELLRKFARFVEDAHGIEMEVDFIPEERWADFYERVRRSRGGVFGIGNVTITESRRDEITFSPPYLSNVATLMTHEEVPELEALDEVGETFAGLIGLSYPGTLHEERLDELRRAHFPEMETVPVESNDELVGRAASGGYFGFIDIYNYWRAVEDGLPLRRHSVADDDSEEFGVIMPRDSDWAPVVDAFFGANEGVQGTDWYRELLQEHLGDELARLLQGEDH